MAEGQCQGRTGQQEKRPRDGGCLLFHCAKKLTQHEGTDAIPQTELARESNFARLSGGAMSVSTM